ncbi:MAG: LytR C-terminal domain-containing protein [bacterium]
MSDGSGIGPAPERPAPEEPGPEGPSEDAAAPEAPAAPEASGYHSRSERRSTRRVTRRRKTISRVYLIAGPVVVLIAAVAALFVFLGGPKSDGVAETTLSTVSAGPVERIALLVVEHEQTTPALVLLLPEDHAGFALAMPGTTLVKTATGFKTLGELHGSHQDEAMASALTEVLGVSVGAVASVQWSQLRAALTQIGSVDPPSAELEASEDDAALAAGAVISLVGAAGSSDGAALWDRLELGGDASAFRRAVGAMAPRISPEAWTQAVIPGRLVEGVGFTYFEPDVERAMAVLADKGATPEITVEVQNGSGVIGVAQEVGRLLEPLGYTLLPFRNSPDFPDVVQTRIVTAPAAAGEAERVLARLGVGRIEEGADLDPGHMIIVVGKDFVPPASIDGEPAG